MKTVFVSAMYTDLHGTSFGGRPGRTDWYRYGLESYTKMGLDTPMQVYTTKNICETGWLNFNHLNPIEYELDTLPFHDRIMEIKTSNSGYMTDISWTMRNSHIMYGKITWILDTIDRLTLTDEDFVYWIDAGLPHTGIFPFECSTVARESHITHKNSFNFDNVFNERLVERLQEVSGDKIFTIGTTEPNGVDHIPDDRFTLENTMYYHYVIGGIFGGKVGQVKKMCEEFNDIMNYLMDKDVLVSEEQILTKMVKFRDDEFTKYEFESWYHEDFYAPGYYNPTLKSFYKIFTEDLGI